jgi:uncharacterized membrane protein
MAIGPVQLLVLGFSQPNFQGEIREELQRLSDSPSIYKDAQGNVSRMRESQLSREEAAEVGAVVGALIGLGAVGEEGMQAGAELGASAARDDDGMLGDEDAWDVLAEIPGDTAAALILLEHRWAIPLRDAIARAGGFRLASEFISPLDLVALGLVKAEEAEGLVGDGYDLLFAVRANSRLIPRYGARSASAKRYLIPTG